MTISKVNRFTFDKHSVILFSALVLAGAGGAANAASTSNALLLEANAETPIVNTQRQQEAENDTDMEVLTAAKSAKK